MTRISMFDNPLLLGFDHFERMVERISKASGDGYPPYNIEQRGDTQLRITLAVAGFTADDLSISVEDNQLIIRGKQEDDRERAYLYRGIAARQFQRTFVLAEGIEVAGATLEDGLLHVDVTKPLPASKTRTIEIRAAGGGAKRLAGADKRRNAS